MAGYDREADKLLARIVYDGPALAGKTTNVRQLCQHFTSRRRGELYTPEERDGRTAYFDWLQVDAGLVGGRGLRCQLVTVPGQPALLRLRAALLTTADVVVFVCSSAPEELEQARDFLRYLQEYLATRAPGEVSLVLQANKQDLPGAFTTEELAERLGLASDVSIVPARASEGTGVRETAALAIRSAANKIQRALLSAGLDSLSTEVETPEGLYLALRALSEHTPALLRAERAAAEPAQSEPEPATKEPEAPVPEPSEASAVEADAAPTETATEPQEEPSRAEPAPPAEEPHAEPELEPALPPRPEPEPLRASVPPASEATATAGVEETAREPVAAEPRVVLVETASLASAPSTVAVAVALSRAEPEALAAEPARGYPPTPEWSTDALCWPSTTAATVLRRVRGERHPREDLVGVRGTGTGSGRSDVYILQVGRWCLKTSERQRYETLAQAEAALTGRARAKLSLRGLLPPDTVLAIAGDGPYWLWTVSRWCPPLRERMSDAERAGDEDSLAEALDLYASATLEALVLAARWSVALDIHPSNFGIAETGLVYLDDDVEVSARIPALGHALLQRAEEYHRWPDAIERYLTSLEDGIALRLQPQDVRWSSVVSLLLECPTRSEAGSAARGRLLAAFGAALASQGVAANLQEP